MLNVPEINYHACISDLISHVHETRQTTLARPAQHHRRTVDDEDCREGEHERDEHVLALVEQSPEALQGHQSTNCV